MDSSSIPKQSRNRPRRTKPNDVNNPDVTSQTTNNPPSQTQPTPGLITLSQPLNLITSSSSSSLSPNTPLRPKRTKGVRTKKVDAQSGSNGGNTAPGSSSRIKHVRSLSDPSVSSVAEVGSIDEGLVREQQGVDRVSNRTRGNQQDQPQQSQLQSRKTRGGRDGVPEIPAQFDEKMHLGPESTNSRADLGEKGGSRRKIASGSAGVGLVGKGKNRPSSSSVRDRERDFETFGEVSGDVGRAIGRGQQGQGNVGKETGPWATRAGGRGIKSIVDTRFSDLDSMASRSVPSQYPISHVHVNDVLTRAIPDTQYDESSTDADEQTDDEQILLGGISKVPERLEQAHQGALEAGAAPKASGLSLQHGRPQRYGYVGDLDESSVWEMPSDSRNQNSNRNSAMASSGSGLTWQQAMLTSPSQGNESTKRKGGRATDNSNSLRKIREVTSGSPATARQSSQLEGSPIKSSSNSNTGSTNCKPFSPHPKAARSTLPRTPPQHHAHQHHQHQHQPAHHLIRPSPLHSASAPPSGPDGKQSLANPKLAAAYAGPTFQNSPSAEALPAPRLRGH